MFWEHFAELDKIKRPLYEKHPMTPFTWTITEETDTVSTFYKTVLFYPSTERYLNRCIILQYVYVRCNNYSIFRWNGIISAWMH